MLARVVSSEHEDGLHIAIRGIGLFSSVVIFSPAQAQLQDSLVNR
jgi:hypothetical protein